MTNKYILTESVNMLHNIMAAMQIGENKRYLDYVYKYKFKHIFRLTSFSEYPLDFIVNNILESIDDYYQFGSEDTDENTEKRANACINFMLFCVLADNAVDRAIGKSIAGFTVTELTKADLSGTELEHLDDYQPYWDLAFKLVPNDLQYKPLNDLHVAFRVYIGIPKYKALSGHLDAAAIALAPLTLCILSESTDSKAKAVIRQLGNAGFGSKYINNSVALKNIFIHIKEYLNVFKVWYDANPIK